MRSILINATTVVIVLGGLGLALFAGMAQSQTAIVALLVYLPLAWLTIFIVALRNPGERRSVLSMLKRFRHQVDLAKQQLSSDSAFIDANVLAAFNKLHAEISALLAQKEIRIAELKRELERFPYPTVSEQGPRWRPPTLSELGYVIGLSENIAPDIPLLALYKFSGEERNDAGSVVDTFTILPASVPRIHAAQFSAKVHAPKSSYIFAINHPAAAPSSIVPAATIAQTRPDEANEVVLATRADNNVGYALSLLGPVTLSHTRELAQNIRAMAHLPVDTAPSSAMTDAWVQRNLRDLLTERLAHSPVPLVQARQALQQEPQLLIAAIADACRGDENNRTTLLPTLATLTEILLPSAPASRPALVALANDILAFIQSLPVISTAHKMVNPGVVYVEARGAESDAAFLQQVAYWLVPGNQDASVRNAQVIMTTSMAEQAFREQLREYSELQPGQENLAVLDVLLVALNTKKLTLHRADGSRPVSLRRHLPATGNKPLRWLLFSANPALADLTDCPPPVQYILWTLTGRALDLGQNELAAQYYLRWHAIIRHAASSDAVARTP